MERQGISFRAWAVTVFISVGLAAGLIYSLTTHQHEEAPDAPVPCPPLATDDNGCAVAVDDLRQVVLHFNDNTVTEYVMNHDDVDGFIRGVQQLDDEMLIGITVYRMRRVWPSSWTRDELATLFGDDHAPVYDWSLHESTLQIDH